MRGHLEAAGNHGRDLAGRDFRSEQRTVAAIRGQQVCIPRNSNSKHAHTKHPGWYLEFESRVTQRPEQRGGRVQSDGVDSNERRAAPTERPEWKDVHGRTVLWGRTGARVEYDRVDRVGSALPVCRAQAPSARRLSRV